MDEKQEKPELQKIIKGKAIKKEPSLWKKIRTVILPADVTDVKSYVVDDIIIPSAIGYLRDIIINTTESLLGKGRFNHGSGTTYSYKNYNTLSDRSLRSDRPDRSLSIQKFNDVILDNRGDAEKVLSTMDEIIDAYGQVRVFDMYELVGVTGDYALINYGWKDLRDARVDRIGVDRYLIVVPNPIPLK